MALYNYKTLRHCLSRLLFVLAVSYILCLLSLLRVEQYSHELQGDTASTQKILREGREQSGGGKVSRTYSKAEVDYAPLNNLESSSGAYKAILLRRLKENVVDFQELPGLDSSHFAVDSSPLSRIPDTSKSETFPNPFSQRPLYIDSESDADQSSEETDLDSFDSVQTSPVSEHHGEDSDRQEKIHYGVGLSSVSFQSLGGEFYVYGAYLDDRYAPDTFVRIMVLRPAQDQADGGSIVHTETRKNYFTNVDADGENDGSTTIWCHFQSVPVYKNFPEYSESSMHNKAKKFITITVRAKSYEMCENHDKAFGGWIYSCPIPSQLVNLTTTPAMFPDTVTLSRTSVGTVSDRCTVENIHLMPLRNDLKNPSLETLAESELRNKRDNNDELNFEPKSTNVEKAVHHEGSMHDINSDLGRRDFTVNEYSSQQKAGYANSRGKNSQSFMNKQRIGVCVPPLYGAVLLQKLINFIEMCRILGADQVFLYSHDSPETLLQYLGNYTGPRPDLLSLVRWDIPVLPQTLQEKVPGSPQESVTSSTDSEPSESPPDMSQKPTPGEEDPDDDPPPYYSDQTVWNHGQLLAVQHCLYSNMADFDWLLFMDIDEMLVPKDARTWPELLQKTLQGLSSSDDLTLDQVAGLSFQSAFFQQDFRNHVTNSIEYFQYLHRTQQTSSPRSKMLVRPRRVFELGIHHLSKPVMNDGEELPKDTKHSKDFTVLKVPPSVALIHHYRKCIQDPDDADGKVRSERIRGSAWTSHGWVPLEDVERSEHGTARSYFECNVLVKDETMLKYEAALTVVSRDVTSKAMSFFAGDLSSIP